MALHCGGERGAPLSRCQQLSKVVQSAARPAALLQTLWTSTRTRSVRRRLVAQLCRDSTTPMAATSSAVA